MIAILSDFGLEDTYVAAMKAVIDSIAPSEKILDLTHDIPPGDIQRGALELWRVAPVLASDTVILGVVDPGVGTARKAVAIKTSRFLCVGPDNGLFSYLLDRNGGEEVVELRNPHYSLPKISSTFHGRDVFSPAAAHLALGVPLTELGPKLSNAQRLPEPMLEFFDPDVLQGEILYADHFGNLVTSIGTLSNHGSNLQLKPWIGDIEPLDLPYEEPIVVIPNGECIPFKRAFGEVARDSLAAYIGSAGLLEIAVNGGSAIDHTGSERGQTVELRTQG